MTIMINPFIPFGPGILRSGDLVRNSGTGQEKLGGDCEGYQNHSKDIPVILFKISNTILQLPTLTFG